MAMPVLPNVEADMAITTLLKDKAPDGSENDVESALEKILDNAYKDNAENKARFLYESVFQRARAQYDVARRILLGHSEFGSVCRKTLLSVLGFSEPEDYSPRVFFYLCLVPEDPSFCLEEGNDIFTSDEDRHVFTNIISDSWGSRNKTRLIQLAIANNLLLESMKADDLDMIQYFTKKDAQKRYFKMGHLLILSGLKSNSPCGSSQMTLNGRKVLLWNYCRTTRDGGINKYRDSLIMTVPNLESMRSKLVPTSRSNLVNYSSVISEYVKVVEQVTRFACNKEAEAKTIAMKQVKEQPYVHYANVVLTSNPLTKEMIEEYALDLCNTEKFFKHKDRYIRIEKSNKYFLPGSFFIAGHCFPAVAASPLGEKLISFVNQILLSQNPLLEKVQSDLRIELCKTQPVNALVIVMKRICKDVGFGKHNDSSQTIVDEGEDTTYLEDNGLLSKQHLLQVVTLVFTYPSFEDESVNCVLNWWHGKKLVGTVTTTYNLMHHQLWGMNDVKMKHCVKWSGSSIIPKAVRVTLTFRRICGFNYTAPQEHQKKVRAEFNNQRKIPKPLAKAEDVYKFTNVMDSLLERNEGRTKRAASTPKPNDGESTGMRQKKRKKTPGPRASFRFKRRPHLFRQLPSDCYKLLLLVPLRAPAPYAEDLGQILVRSRLVSQLLFKEHTLVHSEQGANQRVPRLALNDGKLFRFLDQVNMKAASSNGNVTYSSHVHRICSDHIQSCNQLFLSYPPKNDMHAIKETYNIMKRAVQGDEQALKAKLPLLKVFGVGSSASKTGANAVGDLHRCSKHDKGFTLESPMDYTDLNAVMAEIVRRELIVCVHVNDHMLGLSKKKRGDEGHSLAYYTVQHWTESHGMSDREVREYLKRQGVKGGVEFRYLSMPHMFAILEPLCETCGEWLIFSDKTISEPLKHLYVPWNTNKKMVPTDFLRYKDLSIVETYAPSIYREYIDSRKDDWGQYYWDVVTQGERPEKNRTSKGAEAGMEDMPDEATAEETAEDESAAIEANEVITEEDVEELCGRYELTSIEAVIICILVAASTGYRFFGQSLLYDPMKGSTNYIAMPLIRRWQHWGLGAVLQARSCPCANRLFDVVVAFQMYVMTKYYESHPGAAPLREEPERRRNAFSVEGERYTSEFKFALFMAIIVRFTGNPNTFLGFGDFLENKHGSDYKTGIAQCMPDPNDKESLALFLEYVKCTKTLSGQFGCWISAQHKQSLPSNLKLDEFIEKIAHGLDGLLESLFEHRFCRVSTASVLQDFLVEAMSDSDCAKEMPFLITLIFGDVEESFVDPVGKVTYESMLKWGPGSRAALKLIQVSMSLKTLEEAADAVLQVMKSLPDNWLDVIGWKRYREVVLNTNGRPIGYMDVDQGACKVVKVILWTHASRYSEKPFASIPNNHPYPFGGESYVFEEHFSWPGSDMCDAMTTTVQEFESIMENIELYPFVFEEECHYLYAPDAMRLPGEKESLTSSARKRLGEMRMTKLNMLSLKVGTITQFRKESFLPPTRRVATLRFNETVVVSVKIGGLLYNPQDDSSDDESSVEENSVNEDDEQAGESCAKDSDQEELTDDQVTYLYNRAYLRPI